MWALTSSGAALAVCPGVRWALFLTAAFLETGCVAYAHETTVIVRDPHAVFLRHGSTRIDPSPGQADVDKRGVDVSRDRDGSLSMNGHTLVDASGEVHGTRKADDVSWQGDDVRLRVWYGRRLAFHEWVETPAKNVRMVRDRDAPMRWIGIIEEAYAAGMIGGGFAARSPTTSGSSILFGLGTITAVVGLVQLLAPVKNESTTGGP